MRDSPPAETASPAGAVEGASGCRGTCRRGCARCAGSGLRFGLEFEGVAYGKPHTAEAARERISAMSGNYGVLHTGHALVDLRGLKPVPRCSPALSFLLSQSCPPFLSCAAPPSTLTNSPPRKSRRTLPTGEPLWVAGSFTLDGYGSAFIRGIEGEFHTVVGLSIHALRDMLRRREVAVTELWLAPQNED